MEEIMNYSVFKYKGTKFYMTETSLNKASGTIYKIQGCNIIVINKNKTGKEKSKILHRFLKNKRLHKMI